MSNSFNGFAAQDNSNKLTGKEMFFKYLIYAPLFVICIGLAITFTYLYIRYTVPVYSSSVSLLLKGDRSNRNTSSSENAQLEELLMSRKSINLSNEMEILKSTALMQRVVRSLNLNVKYFSFGKVKRSELYGDKSPIIAAPIFLRDSLSNLVITLTPQKNNQVLAEYDYKKVLLKSGDTIRTSKGMISVAIDNSKMRSDYKYFVYWLANREVAAELASKLTINQLSREASILKLNITTEIPKKGKDVLNQLIKEYDRQTVEDKNRIVDNTIRFIEERLVLLSSELDKVEGGLQGLKQKYNMVNLQKQSDAGIDQIKELRAAVTTQDISLSIIDEVSRYVSNQKQKYLLVPSNLGLPDVTLTALIARYNELQSRRATELETVKPEHPQVKVIEAEIERLRTSILENLSNIRTSVLQLRDVKQREYDYVQSSLRTIPEKERELQEVLREQGIKEKLFLFLLQKREEFAISRASAIGNSTPIDEAVSSKFPVSPNKGNLYRIAIILGLLIPIAYIYAKDLLNDKIITKTDITKATQVPIIGEVAHHTSQTRKFVVGFKDRSILSEQFRIIRTNLQFLMANAPSKNPVFLVTSSIAGEGKTFSSMNLAAVWAVAGKKTVILELDLRKPKISKSLGLPSDKGITNYILGTVPKEQLPQPLPELPNLSVIAAGPIPPNPSEMIMDVKMAELFTYLRANYDIIIIDSAPIGLVSDSKILSKFADVSVYVVRQRYTVKKQLPFINDLYEQNVLPHMGIIVNDVKVGGANSYYGYGYGYGYGYSYNYSYSYRYGDEKKSFFKRMKQLVGIEDRNQS